MSNICCSCSLFLNHSGDAQGVRHQQGLHFSTASHLRVRWFKPLVQFSPQYQRTRHKEGVFQIIGSTECSIEKGVAEIGPLGFVLASERRVVSICRGDDKRISIGETRYEDARIASRNDHDLVSHFRAPSISERWDGLRVSASRPATTARPSREPCDVRIRNRMSLSPFIFFASACNVVASVSTVALPPVLVLYFTTTGSPPEPIGDDLRCTGGLTPKNAFIAKQTE